MREIRDVVIFEVDGALFAVTVEQVQEVLDLRPSAPLPSAPRYVLGVIDLRGANIPVVDMRRLLGKPQIADTSQTRIMVVTMANAAGQTSTIGIKTDRVLEVTPLDDGSFELWSKAEVLQWGESAVYGIGRRNGQVVSVLDVDRLFKGVPEALGEDA